MILRNRKINPNASDIQISISYSAADVKQAFVTYHKSLAGYSYDYQWAETCQQSIQDLQHYLTHTVFQYYESKWADQLADWMITQALKNKLIKADPMKPNTYYLTELCRKKVGRPKKEK